MGQTRPIDEAGQFSLANALAVAPAAKRLVLLGDPQQLNQPLKGIHPPGAELSVLEHLAGEGGILTPERGLFLGGTWRMRPFGHGPAPGCGPPLGWRATRRCAVTLSHLDSKVPGSHDE